MSRTLAPALSAIINADALKGALLFELDHSTDPARAWNGQGTFRWDGKEFLGIGSFGTVSDISENTEGKVTGATFDLANIDPGVLRQSLDEVETGQEASLWFAAIEECPNGYALIGEPLLLFRGLVDHAMSVDDLESAAIRLITEQETRAATQSRRRTYTDASQQARYPGDTFFAQLPLLRLHKFPWGLNEDTFE